MDLTLFSGLILSSHCSLEWWTLQGSLGGLEFTLFSGDVKSSYCSVGWSGVHAVVLKTEWGYGVKTNGEVCRGFLRFGWIWGPSVIYRLQIRNWAENLKEKKNQRIALVFDKILKRRGQWTTSIIWGIVQLCPKVWLYHIIEKLDKNANYLKTSCLIFSGTIQSQVKMNCCYLAVI